MHQRAVRRAPSLAAAAVLGIAISAAILPRPTRGAEPVGVDSVGADSVHVVGNHRVEAATVRAYFVPPAGGALDAKALDAGLKALYASGLFTDAKIAHGADGLTVTVVEAPVIARIAFEGNSALKDKDLTPELTSKVHGGLIPASVQADVARLTEIYRRSGRFDVAIVPKTISPDQGRVDLVFEIHEGSKTTVKRVDFAGNHAFAAARLRGVVKTGATGLFSFLTGSDVYDPDRLDADRDLLRRYYVDRGFADVQVAAPRAVYDPALKGIVVAFTVDEGAPYRLGTVDVQSHVAAVDGRALSSLVGTLALRPGDTYDAALVDKTVDTLTIALAKGGHPFASVRAERARDPAAHTIGVVFAVEPGPRRYVERIEIRGNAKTRDYVVRRELDIAEGDAYNGALIDRAERRLKALEFFKTVKITTAPGSAPDRVVVDIDLVEQQTGDFNFGVGYSTQDGVIGNVTLSDRNLLGRGETGKIDLTLGQYTKSVDIGFVEPDVLDSRVSVGGDLYGKQTTASSFQSYGSTIYGLGVKAGLPITETTSAQLRYSIYNQSVTVDPATAGGTVSLPVQQAAAAGPQWLSLVGYTLAYDTVDNRKSPTDGVHAEFKQDIAGLGGDVNFLKTSEDVRAYHPVTDDIVASAREQSGFVAPWGGKDVPLLNRFFGGPQLVRGFAPNGIGPRDLTPGSTMDNIGGTAFWGTSTEVQTAIPYLPSDFALKFAVFADAGSVWGTQGLALSQNFATGSAGTIRSSFGAGLIWGSPFGPIRVDYAMPVTQASFDKTQRLSFSAGGF
jgi:outer membrane protein insertion porin family